MRSLISQLQQKTLFFLLVSSFATLPGYSATPAKSKKKKLPSQTQSQARKNTPPLKAPVAAPAQVSETTSASAKSSQETSSTTPTPPAPASTKRFSGAVDTYLMQGLGEQSTLTNLWDAELIFNVVQKYDVGTELGYTHMFTRYQGPGKHNDFNDTVLYLQGREMVGKSKSLFWLDAQLRFTLPSAQNSRDASLRAAYSVQGYAKSVIGPLTLKLKEEIGINDYQYDSSSAYGGGSNPHYFLNTQFVVDYKVLSWLVSHNTFTLFNNIKYSGYRNLDYRIAFGVLASITSNLTLDVNIRNGDNFYYNTGLFTPDRTSIKGGLVYEF